MNQFFADGLFKGTDWQISLDRIAGVRYLRAPNYQPEPDRVIVLLDTGKEVMVACPAFDVMQAWRWFSQSKKAKSEA